MTVIYPNGELADITGEPASEEIRALRAERESLMIQLGAIGIALDIFSDKCPSMDPAECVRQLKAAFLAADARAKALEAAGRELLEVADLRGDSDLPHPAKDDKFWTARMQTAWDDFRAALAGEKGGG